MDAQHEVARANGPLQNAIPATGLLQSFYAGDQIPCPRGCGGTAHAIRVGTRGDGAGQLWLECNCCAQRELLLVPPATHLELSSIPTLTAPGETLHCPRHALRVPLRQQGRRLICPECGVRFRD